MGKNLLSKHILSTVIYSDIFDYPLSQDEIWRYLVYENISGLEFNSELNRLLKQKKLFKSKNYFYLKNRVDIVKYRLERQKISEIKLKIAKRIGKILSIIPTISFLGISGSLSIKNAKENDDIDYFIITFANTLWLTRLIVFIALSFLKVRRGKNELYSPNKICTNLFIDTSALKFNLSKENIYIAHEIVQILPIFQRNKCYDKFINKNGWIKYFLPNFKIEKVKETFYIWEKLFLIFLPIEFLAMKLELLYMRKRDSNNITKHKAIFYPGNFEKRILDIYNNRIKKYV